MNLDVVQTLQDLVRLPSVNPMGREVQGEEYLEHQMTDYLEQWFQALDVPYYRQQLEPKRANIVARLDGDLAPEEGGSIIMFEAHQDTVPVDGMIIDPWDPVIRDGRVLGRGACDIKGGMACMLIAFARLAAERPPTMPTVVMACSVNEEFGFTGAEDMNRLWTDGDERWLPKPPDAVVVAEPTLLDVVVAHKGVARWRCHTRGLAGHSAQPEKGENAIYRMAQILSGISQYASQTVATLGDHPLVGRPTVSVGRISGGISINTVPDQCTIEIDRRVLPREDPSEAWQHLVDVVAQTVEQTGGENPATAGWVEHEEPFLAKPGLSDDDNGPLAAALQQTIQQAGHAGNLIGVPYGTDAPAFAGHGIPAVVFGPGCIDQAHTVDEWVAIEQLEAATEIYYQFGKLGLAD
jgi:acetylornithine deacetylase